MRTKTNNMRAALYARYSTDRQKKESATDQLALLRKRCAAEGWTVVGEFSDPGISGGTANRPGYQRMLASARQHEFDLVLAEDTSRLWRNMAEQAPRLAEFADLGIAVVTLSGMDSRDASFSLVAPVLGVVAEMGRKEASYRTKRGRRAAAERGTSTGGKAFGYVSETRADGTKHLCVHPEQASVVRRVFEMYADGMSPRAIAATLNAEHVPSPGASWSRTGEKRRDGKWQANAIHGQWERGTGILNNAKYVGRFVWGRTEWVRSAQDSKKRRVLRKASADVSRVDESLRIVSDALWARVRTRQQAQQRECGDAVRKALRAGPKPKYLLSGILKCSACGASMVMNDAAFYICSTYRGGGPAACANAMRVKRAVAESRLLQNVKDTIFADEFVEAAQHEVHRVLKDKAQARGADQAQAQKLLAQVEREIANIARAIKAGIITETTKAELVACETERARLQGEIAGQGKRDTSNVVRLIPALVTRYRTLVQGLEARAARADAQTFAQAQSALRALLGEVRVEVEEHEGRRVPVAVFDTGPHVLLRVAGAGDVGMGNAGSGGRI